MATSVAIRSITASTTVPGSADIVTVGTAAGTVRFKASRLPYLVRALDVSCTGSGTNFVVALPYTDALWYVWMGDNNGWNETVHAIVIPGVLDIGQIAVFEEMATDVGKAVAKVLLDNQPGIQAILRHKYPDVSVQYVQFGYGGDIERFPAIIVSQPRWRSKVVGIPLTFEISFTLAIAFLGSLSSDDQSQLDFAADFAAAGMRVLNNPAYLRMETPGGIKLYEARASTGEASMDSDGKTFMSKGMIAWSAQTMLTEAGPV